MRFRIHSPDTMYGRGDIWLVIHYWYRPPLRTVAGKPVPSNSVQQAGIHDEVLGQILLGTNVIHPKEKTLSTIYI